MFLSYSCDEWYGSSHYIYIMRDDDFEVTVSINGQDYDDLGRVVIALIEEYERRNLPVATNLFRLAQSLKEASIFTSLDQIFNYWGKIPQFAKYKTEMEKYMVLL